MSEKVTLVNDTSVKVQELGEAQITVAPKAKPPEEVDSSTPTETIMDETTSTENGADSGAKKVDPRPLPPVQIIEEEVATTDAAEVVETEVTTEITVETREFTGLESTAVHSHLLPLVLAGLGGIACLSLALKKRAGQSCVRSLLLLGGTLLVMAFSLFLFKNNYYDALVVTGDGVEPGYRTLLWVLFSPLLLATGISLSGFHFHNRQLTLLIFLLLPAIYAIQGIVLLAAIPSPALKYVLLSLTIWLNLGYLALFFGDLHRNRHFLHPKVRMGALLVFCGLSGGAFLYTLVNALGISVMSNHVRIIIYNLTDIAVIGLAVFGVLQLALTTSLEEAEGPKIKKERKPTFDKGPGKPMPGPEEEPKAEETPGKKPKGPASKPAAPPPPSSKTASEEPASTEEQPSGEQPAGAETEGEEPAEPKKPKSKPKTKPPKGPQG